jgi:hypothetical protein
VPILEGRPRFRIVKEPKGDERLKGFSAGQAFKWERDVTSLVRQKYDEGLVNFPRLKLLGMTSESGDVLGFCGWHPREPQFPVPGTPMSEPPYIHLIGLAHDYHPGWYSEDGLRLGSELLLDALKKITIQWAAPAMPPVWALVDKLNEPSHNLFERHGFGRIEKKGGDDRQYRPYGIPIF